MLRELIVSASDAPPRRQQLNEADSITIGRAPTNKLSFPAEISLSRQHALIQRSDDGWILVDLGSTNGTRLNGARITEQVALSEGDRIEIGDVTITCVGNQATPLSLAIPGAAPPSPAVSGGGAELVFPGQRGLITVTDPTPFTYGRSSVLFRTQMDGKDLCIKLFSIVQGAEWLHVEAFEREVLAQSNLEHPHILQVLDYGLHSRPHGSPFVVLPYCAGGSFRGLLRDRAFYPLATVLPLLIQLAEALDFAHASGFVHGDVKPENFLLSTGRKQAFLSDFGMSNVFAIQESFSTVAAAA